MQVSLLSVLSGSLDDALHEPSKEIQTVHHVCDTLRRSWCHTLGVEVCIREHRHVICIQYEIRLSVEEVVVCCIVSRCLRVRSLCYQIRCSHTKCEGNVIILPCYRTTHKQLQVYHPSFHMSFT